MPEAREIEFELTREDYILCARERSAPDRERFRLRRGLMLGAALGSTVLYSLALYTNYRGAIDPGNALVLAFGGGIAYLWWWTIGACRATTTRAIERRLGAQADTDDALRAQGKHRVTLTPSDLRWESRGMSWTGPWSQILSVTDPGSFVLIATSTDGGVMIPKRAFASADDFAAFLDTARRFHAAAPSASTERLREYLATRSASCPKCAYSLGGIRDHRCPECGTPLDLEALRERPQELS